MAWEVAPRTFVASSDGTRIAYYDTGGDLPPVVLANGLGGPFRAWRYQVDYLRERYRVVSWDYRGLYHSERPTSEPPALDLEHQVSDLQDLLRETGIESAAFIGWSLGVQVLLALYQRARAQVANLVLLNGTYGKPLEAAAAGNGARFLPMLVEATQRYHEVGTQLFKRTMSLPETPAWVKRLGVVGGTMDVELLREMIDEIAELDVGLFLRTLVELGQRDQSELLGGLDVPVLLLAGENDPFTSTQLAKKMAETIPKSELLVVRDATHYLAAEHPELVNLRIEKFFHEHGYV
jgi:pimeloyl-ACP methyl ester carboxylesterase